MDSSFRVTRRDFLKLAGSTLASAALAYLPAPISIARQNQAELLGRVAAKKSIDSYDSPTTIGKKVASYKRDEILTIADTALDPDPSLPNRLWYMLSNSQFVHSAWIQPVSATFNQPNNNIPAGGTLAEVTVPFTEARANRSMASHVVYRMYYQTTYWVTALMPGKEKDGKYWYLFYDDLRKVSYFAPADSLRILPPEELAPLAPNIDPALKRIEVRLNPQTVTAFEDNRIVREMRCSSGKRRYGRYTTPLGKFITFHKRPTRHMAAGNPAATGYDLPGVPWVSYITGDGISFHGTFWHNDFGTPHSHGCLNLTTDDAKWLYLWTLPVVQPGQDDVYEKYGTSILITE